MASLEDIRKTRLEKLEKLKKAGIDPYPAKARRTHTNKDAVHNFDELSNAQEPLTLAGRVMALRGQGALSFVVLDDGQAEFQALLKRDQTEEFDLFKEVIDVGDFVEVTGVLFTTKRGEKTVEGHSWRILSKSLRPLPEKWHGLQDREEKYRRRYLDTIMSPESKERFITRARITKALRRALDAREFLEVETPILQPLAGGATALPFVTHHNALDIDMYLRVAPELYLKELLIGGFPKVYEIGRLFRNEGIDKTHNPEFTTLEFYEAYTEAREHRAFLEDTLRELVEEVCGTSTVFFNEETIDFSQEFQVISYYELLKEYAGIDNPDELSKEALREKASELDVKVEDSDSKVKIFDSIYKKTARPSLIQPTYIIDYPIEFSPLAKEKPDNPRMVDRFQLVIGGLEVVNAFSELNDPVAQRKRFQGEEETREGGDEEAQPHDESFIEALEYGMPPAGGVGLSIDRLAMLLTDSQNIREVILFPTLRPRND